MAGFTAERDMGTEGAGSADTAVRNAIDQGADSRPAPARQRQRDIRFSAATKTPSASIPRSMCCRTPITRTTPTNSLPSIREQHKEGADFVKIYETGRDSFSAMENSPRHISTPKPNSLPPCKKPRAWASASPSTPPANRALSMPRKQESFPWTTPTQLSDGNHAHHA